MAESATIAALKAADAEGSPGPWEVVQEDCGCVTLGVDSCALCDVDLGSNVFSPESLVVSASGMIHVEDARLIALARNNVAALLAVAEWAQDAPHHHGCHAFGGATCICGRDDILAALGPT